MGSIVFSKSRFASPPCAKESVATEYDACVDFQKKRLDENKRQPGNMAALPFSGSVKYTGVGDEVPRLCTPWSLMTRKLCFRMGPGTVPFVGFPSWIQVTLGTIVWKAIPVKDLISSNLHGTSLKDLRTFLESEDDAHKVHVQSCSVGGLESLRFGGPFIFGMNL